MKTTLHYSTFMTAVITTVYGNAYQYDFPKSLSLGDAHKWAKESIHDGLIEIRPSLISMITFIDSRTGEILMECERNPEENPNDYIWYPMED